MTDDKKAASNKIASGDKVHGEGNYDATRDYDKRTEDFIAKKKAEIPGMAKDAEEALEGPEGDKLREAEDKGKAKARH